MKMTGLILFVLLASCLTPFAQTAIPPVGTVFNESEWLADSITGRKLLRLTKNRDFNQTPTYHINTGFSADSKTMVFATWNKDGESALIEGNVITGDLKVVAVVPSTEKNHFNGNNVCMIPASRKAAASRGGTKLYVYDLNTLGEKLLYAAEDGYSFGHPTGSADGKTIYITKMPRYRQGIDNPYPDAFSIYYSIITDGLMFGKFITEIDWTKTDSQGIPILNVLGAHNSGNHSFGQHTHPHCLMSPDGKYLSYNRGTQHKSDVYVLVL